MGDGVSSAGLRDRGLPQVHGSGDPERRARLLGRLLVCSFRFSEGDPASAWLRNALVCYAAGERFDPPQELTAAQLGAVLDAPLLSGERDTNRAVNVNDPASLVRANELAQP